jgi:hypothetical protein
MKCLEVVLNNAFTLFHCVKSIGYKLKNVLKGILYLLDYFQILLDAKLTYLKWLHINITYTFNINLVY